MEYSLLCNLETLEIYTQAQCHSQECEQAPPKTWRVCHQSKLFERVEFLWCFYSLSTEKEEKKIDMLQEIKFKFKKVCTSFLSSKTSNKVRNEILFPQNPKATFYMKHCVTKQHIDREANNDE